LKTSNALNHNYHV